MCSWCRRTGRRRHRPAGQRPLRRGGRGARRHDRRAHRAWSRRRGGHGGRSHCGRRGHRADGHLIPDGEMYDVADSIPAATGGTPVSDGSVHPLHLVEVRLDARGFRAGPALRPRPSGSSGEQPSSARARSPRAAGSSGRGCRAGRRQARSGPLRGRRRERRPASSRTARPRRQP